jgi:hypothetical protein
MKTENRLNHIMHLLLCLLTVGLWVPVYIIRLCANEMANRIVRAYNKGYSDSPYFIDQSGAYSQNRAGDAVNPAPAAGYLQVQNELRELQSRLSRCEFDRSLYCLRLEQLVRALGMQPFTNVPTSVREAYETAQKLVFAIGDLEYTRVIKNADQQLEDLRRLMTALTNMTDPEDNIVAHPGPELTKLQAAYKQAGRGMYWGRRGWQVLKSAQRWPLGMRSSTSRVCCGLSAQASSASLSSSDRALICTSVDSC